MKAKELMLFDFVRRKKDGKVMTVVELRYAETIAAITPDDVYYGDMEDYHESEIEPIPLTPEILEKNGFEKTRGMGETIYTFSDNTEYYAIAIDEYSDTIWRVEYTNCEFNFPLIRNMVCYVHELQHCLKLVGIDKEITI